ncbi:hypothetical protein TTRE_0000931101 [Trichuris trichiura]|uniref:Uncharacterized protein n=1 Tax=Trichuris trichiura TaxID=36087 RepID=A0A077ZKL4_TRITR|nr:hypothetical protein TTRE_0000931101 [Trichuris trichiura]
MDWPDIMVLVKFSLVFLLDDFPDNNVSGVEDKTEYDPQLIHYAVQLCSIVLAGRRFISDEAVCVSLLSLAKAVAVLPEGEAKSFIRKIAGTDGMVLQLCHDRSKFVNIYAFKTFSALFYGKSETHVADMCRFIIDEIKALVTILGDYFSVSSSDGLPVGESVCFHSDQSRLCALKRIEVQILDFIVVCKQLVTDRSLNSLSFLYAKSTCCRYEKLIEGNEACRSSLVPSSASGCPGADCGAGWS